MMSWTGCHKNSVWGTAFAACAFIMGNAVLPNNVLATESTGQASSPSGEALPNFVIFLADDLGWGDLACYGHPIIESPNLDSFAQQGIRFTQCYSGGSVCSPSRSAILTGRTPYRNGVFTWIPANDDIHLRKSEITIAKLLKRKGYATCHVGKWHLNSKFNSPEQPQPNDHGYDWWLATRNNAGPSHHDPDNFVRNGTPAGLMKGYSAPLIVDESINWLSKHWDRTKPFYLAVWTHEPHLPIATDPRFTSLYGNRVKDNDQAIHHGNVSQLDHAFGTLMKKLDEMHLTENTFVMFTSDNGPEGRGDKGVTRGSTGGLRGRKRSMHEGGIRVPGMVRWPGHVKAGSVSDTPITGADIFTTICDIVDIPLPADRTIDGASMLPVFQDKSIDRKVPMYWRWDNVREKVQVAIRLGEWKLLASKNRDYFELYNLKHDPQETNELSKTEPERFSTMRTTLQKLDTEIEAEGPDWWKGYFERQKRSQLVP